MLKPRTAASGLSGSPTDRVIMELSVPEWAIMVTQINPERAGVCIPIDEGPQVRILSDN